MNYSTPAAAAAALHDLNGVEYPVGSGFRLKVMFAEIMTGSNSSSNPGGSSTAALLRSSSSSRSLGGPQGSGSLGAIMRASSGNFAMQGQHGSSGALTAGAHGSGGSFGSGSMHGAQVMSAGPNPMSVVTPVGQGMGGPVGTNSTAGSSALLSPAGSDPNSSSSNAPASMGGIGHGVIGSAGPSTAASPLCDAHHMYHQQHQQQNDLVRVTDRLSSLSLPNMGAHSPQHGLNSIGSEHSKDLAVAAAAAAAVAASAQHYSDLKAAASGGTISNTGGWWDILLSYVGLWGVELGGL